MIGLIDLQCLLEVAGDALHPPIIRFSKVLTRDIYQTYEDPFVSDFKLWARSSVGETSNPDGNNGNRHPFEGF